MFEFIKNITSKILKKKYNYQAPLQLNKRNPRYYKSTKYTGNKKNLDNCQKYQKEFYESINTESVKSCELPDDMQKILDEVLSELNKVMESEER